MRAGYPDSGLAAGARSSGLVAGDLGLGFGAPGSGLKAQGSGLGARGWKLGLRIGLERRARAAGLGALGWGLGLGPGAESLGLLARSGYCVLKFSNFGTILHNLTGQCPRNESNFGSNLSSEASNVSVGNNRVLANMAAPRWLHKAAGERTLDSSQLQ